MIDCSCSSVRVSRRASISFRASRCSPSARAAMAGNRAGDQHGALSQTARLRIIKALGRRLGGAVEVVRIEQCHRIGGARSPVGQRIRAGFGAFLAVDQQGEAGFQIAERHENAAMDRLKGNDRSLILAISEPGFSTKADLQTFSQGLLVEMDERKPMRGAQGSGNIARLEGCFISRFCSLERFAGAAFPVQAHGTVQQFLPARCQVPIVP
ncbi:hypothetical protein [Rhizobium acidisoli]|uniref:hypothetical protein n=2 Tax=Rhizobium acidisoli TaxID=1538158 RepID=UPI001FD95B89|nr:hypothetical protein [Rhizobium acidisoli]